MTFSCNAKKPNLFQQAPRLKPTWEEVASERDRRRITGDGDDFLSPCPLRAIYEALVSSHAQLARSATFFICRGRSVITYFKKNNWGFWKKLLRLYSVRRHPYWHQKNVRFSVPMQPSSNNSGRVYITNRGSLKRNKDSGIDNRKLLFNEMTKLKIDSKVTSNKLFPVSDSKDSKVNFYSKEVFSQEQFSLGAIFNFFQLFLSAINQTQSYCLHPLTRTVPAFCELLYPMSSWSSPDGFVTKYLST